jgi:hypothetical protein
LEKTLALLIIKVLLLMFAQKIILKLLIRKSPFFSTKVVKIAKLNDQNISIVPMNLIILSIFIFLQEIIVCFDNCITFIPAPQACAYEVKYTPNLINLATVLGDFYQLWQNDCQFYQKRPCYDHFWAFLF